MAAELEPEHCRRHPDCEAAHRQEEASEDGVEEEEGSLGVGGAEGGAGGVAAVYQSGKLSFSRLAATRSW